MLPGYPKRLGLVFYGAPAQIDAAFDSKFHFHFPFHFITFSFNFTFTMMIKSLTFGALISTNNLKPNFIRLKMLMFFTGIV